MICTDVTKRGAEFCSSEYRTYLSERTDRSYGHVPETYAPRGSATPGWFGRVLSTRARTSVSSA